MTEGNIFIRTATRFFNAMLFFSFAIQLKKELNLLNAVIKIQGEDMTEGNIFQRTALRFFGILQIAFAI